MKRSAAILAATLLSIDGLAGPSFGRGNPQPNVSELSAVKMVPSTIKFDGASLGVSGQSSLSKKQVEAFRCDSSGDPAETVDISCNDTELGQDYSPDNEIAIAVDPDEPDHLLAGSNDYFYSFNTATGARFVLVPTGFFTSFDGGATWIDGQIPVRSGNGAGDPAPAFDKNHGVALMGQLENVEGQGGPWVSQGDVSVSRSTDSGVTWSSPVTVLQGHGAGIGLANQAVFYDKDWLTVDNNPGSPFYGRAYVTSSRFLNGLFGSYSESPIYLSYSDDGGLTWSPGKEISGSNSEVCTFQVTGPDDECDQDQDSYPEVASDGTLFTTIGNPALLQDAPRRLTSR